MHWLKTHAEAKAVDLLVGSWHGEGVVQEQLDCGHDNS